MLQVSVFAHPYAKGACMFREGILGSARACTFTQQQTWIFSKGEVCMCVYVCLMGSRGWGGGHRKRLGYDPKLISSHCTKSLLNVHTEPALLHHTQFREYTHAPCTWFIHCTADFNMKMQTWCGIPSKGQDLHVWSGERNVNSETK